MSVREGGTATTPVALGQDSVNARTYLLLLQLEIGLREFLIDRLSAVCGARWWTERVPGPVLSEATLKLQKDSAAPWARPIPHHPIYYIEFAELRPIVERSDNWRDVFRTVFERKDVFLAALDSVLPIRNRVAHNRLVSEADLELVKSVLRQFMTALGPSRFGELLYRAVLPEDIPEQIERLAREVECAAKAMEACHEASKPEVWLEVENAWWFDPSYLRIDIAPIGAFFECVDRYLALPHGRGTGHKTEEWLKKAEFQRLTREARVVIDSLKDRRAANGLD